MRLPAAPAGVAPELGDVLRSLARKGFERAEVYAKRGRSRRVEVSPAGETSGFAQERAWAVRAGGDHGSFFFAGTGEPRPLFAWPEPAGPPLALPAPEPAPPWSEPADFDVPLLGEAEGLKLLASLGRELAEELPGARVLSAALEDGWSESEVASSRGIAARGRRRAAALHVVAQGPERGASAVSLYLAEREARRFHPAALARRLADRLAVAAAVDREPAPGASEVLLAPAVSARLLTALLPLLMGSRAVALGTGLRDRRGRLASELVTIVDDGRLPGGALEAPVDGEGVPTRAVTLVEEGLFHQPLLAWWQAGEGVDGRPSGCCRRASWRDLPAPGPTHLYLVPDARTSVGALLGTIRRGAYLIDAAGPARVDFDALRFELPACGFLVEHGRAASPLPRVVLRGGLGALLKGVAGVARDLQFFPLDGMIGAPTLLVAGLEVTEPGPS